MSLPELQLNGALVITINILSGSYACRRVHVVETGRPNRVEQILRLQSLRGKWHQPYDLVSNILT